MLNVLHFSASSTLLDELEFVPGLPAFGVCFRTIFLLLYMLYMCPLAFSSTYIPQDPSSLYIAPFVGMGNVEPLT